MLRAVLDTNQFVSSLIAKHGPSAQLLYAWREHAYLLITSRAILEEIERVLRYPRIAHKYHVSADAIQALLDLLAHEALVISQTPALRVVRDDPADDKFLACALAADAKYIVSGDHHLLDLKRYQEIEIVTATEFLAILAHYRE